MFLLLRKDFIIDEYQITEARVARADMILLIVAAYLMDSYKIYMMLRLGWVCSL